jgi:phenylacetate-CoA ligase
VNTDAPVPLEPIPQSLPYLGAAAAGVAGLFVERIGSAGLLRSYQIARLRALLRHSYATVPFYRQRFQRAGFHPDQLRTLDDLQRVPLTPKDELRVAAEQDVLAKDCNPAGLLRYGTGGSTGQPTEVRFTRFEDLLLRVMRMQVMLGYGLRVWDRRAALVYSDGPHRTSMLKRLGILRNQTIHAHTPWEQMRTELRGIRPNVIRGYPSIVASAADKLTDEDRNLIRPRFITTDSAKLTDLARSRIETSFGAPVFDVYDCYECNVIAYQCPRSEQYHVLDASVIVEVLHEGRPARPGESGEIAFTSLHTWAAPLIRYMPGDVVERGIDHCSCGAPNSCLANITGRVQDRFVLPDGQSIHPGFLAASIYPLCPVLRSYQIVQEAVDRVVVRLQPTPGIAFPHARLEAARKNMARDLGEGVTLRIDFVDEIPPEPNGKFRPYRCDVKNGELHSSEPAEKLGSRN